MNLNGIVSGVIAAINPLVNCQLQVSAGLTIQPDGTRAPAYNTFFPVPCQIQALTYSDLQKMDGLNVQGIRRAIYLNGTIEGVDRAAIKGGDIFTFPDGTGWLVAIALESWPDWSKLAVTKQVS